MKKSILLAGLLVTGARVQAQPFVIESSRIAGGGGTSTNGPLSLSGTIGQHDAGTIMSGSNFSIAGGFWSGISVVQTLGAPQLSIQFFAGNAIVSWTADKGADFVLEQTSALQTPASWGSAGTTLSTNGNTIHATVPAGAGIQFFRLRRP